MQICVHIVHLDNAFAVLVDGIVIKQRHIKWSEDALLVRLRLHLFLSVKALLQTSSLSET